MCFIMTIDDMDSDYGYFFFHRPFVTECRGGLFEFFVQLGI